MSMLSREQYCGVVDEATSGRYFSQTEVLSIEATLKAHDATQRALLRQREEALERTKELLQRRSRIGDEDRALALDLRAQLAAVTAERDEYRTKARWKHAHDDSLELELQKQLAASLARCAQVEEALRGILEIGKRDMTNAKYDGYFEYAQQALTSTERPPA